MSQHVCCAQIYIFLTERTVPFSVLACFLMIRRDFGGSWLSFLVCGRLSDIGPLEGLIPSLGPYLVLSLSWEAR